MITMRKKSGIILSEICEKISLSFPEESKKIQIKFSRELNN